MLTYECECKKLSPPHLWPPAQDPDPQARGTVCKGDKLKGEGGNHTYGNGLNDRHNTWSWGCVHHIFGQAEAEVQQATQQLILVIFVQRAGGWEHVLTGQRGDSGHQNHLK